MSVTARNPVYVAQPADLDRLIAAMAVSHEVIGPKVDGRAVVYGRISGAAELPQGMREEQAPGRYRLVPSGRKAFFDFTFGSHGWKPFLSPPSAPALILQKAESGWEAQLPSAPARPMALFGVRPCELSAIAMQDRIYTQGEHTDEIYASRRKGAFIVAVNCARPSGACFCASMGTGPKAMAGFDAALTEVLDRDAHYFLVEAGTQAGRDMLVSLNLKLAEEGKIEAGAAVTAKATASMGKSVNVAGLTEALAASYDNPRWAQTGARCLACGSCAAVCPTCFCLKYEDLSGLAGDISRRRSWDVCLSRDFSYIHGGATRPSPAARYRHFVIHKLSAWVDQFGARGCVGCGRCAVWCPAKIDIAEEAGAISSAPMGKPGGAG